MSGEQTERSQSHITVLPEPEYAMPWHAQYRACHTLRHRRDFFNAQLPGTNYGTVNRRQLLFLSLPLQ